MELLEVSESNLLRLLGCFSDAIEVLLPSADCI